MTVRCGSCSTFATGAAKAGWRLSALPGWVRCPRCVASANAMLYNRTFCLPEGARVRRRQRFEAGRDAGVPAAPRQSSAEALERQARVREMVLQDPSVSVAAVVRELHVSATTASRIRRALVAEGLVPAATPGRRAAS